MAPAPDAGVFPTGAGGGGTRRTRVSGVAPPTPVKLRSTGQGEDFTADDMQHRAGLLTRMVLSLERMMGAARVARAVLRISSVPPSRLNTSVTPPPAVTLMSNVPPALTEVRLAQRLVTPVAARPRPALLVVGGRRRGR